MAKKVKTAANGEGSVFFNKRLGKWVCEITNGWQMAKAKDGTMKPKRVVVRFSDEKQAKVLAWKTDQLKKRKDGALPKPDAKTVQQHMENWLENVVAIGRRPTTHQNYKDVCRAYIFPAIGSVKLQKLTSEQVQNMVAAYRRTGPEQKSASTVRLALAVLHKALDHAMAGGLLSRNPADKSAVERPKADGKKMAVLDRSEAARLLSVAAQDRMFPLFALTLQTGLRIGEVLGLRWGDVNLEARRLVVENTLHSIRGHISFGEPKTAAGRRVIDLPDSATETLRRWRQQQAEERMAAGLGKQKLDTLVFSTAIQTPLQPSNVRRTLNALLTRAGLKHVRFHDLRHSALTFRRLAGVNLKTLQEQAGHSRFSVTMDTYGHVLPEEREEAAKKVNAFWSTM